MSLISPEKLNKKIVEIFAEEDGETFDNLDSFGHAVKEIISWHTQQIVEEIKKIVLNSRTIHEGFGISVEASNSRGQVFLDIISKLQDTLPANE